MPATAKQVLNKAISQEEEALKIQNELYFYERKFKEYVVSLFNPILDESNTND